jgi:hypothetical protein
MGFAVEPNCNWFMLAVNIGTAGAALLQALAHICKVILAEKGELAYKLLLNNAPNCCQGTT